ncbi:MAG: hypothetical protein RBT81_12700 [Gammaproteobacteria bacterium]|nr:hypothetical protein [Gammaproteobacteria bacterium]
MSRILALCLAQNLDDLLFRKRFLFPVRDGIYQLQIGPEISAVTSLGSAEMRRSAIAKPRLATQQGAVIGRIHTLNAPA